MLPSLCRQRPISGGGWVVPVACPQGKSFEMILWLPILAKMFRNNVYDQENEK